MGLVLVGLPDPGQEGGSGVSRNQKAPLLAFALIVIVCGVVVLGLI